MDTYENNNLENESVVNESADTQSQQPVQPEQPQQSQQNPYGAYSGSGAGRKESPFADSPYYSNYQNYQQNPNPNGAAWQTPPVKQKKEKKAKAPRSGRVGRAVIAAVLAVVLVAGSCFATAWIVNDQWTDRSAQMQEEFNNKLEDLQVQVDAALAEAESAKANNSGNTSVSNAVSTSSGMTPSQVYNQNVNSVVAISNQATTNYYGQVTETASSGSGFILTEDGYVVTNYHVVEGATKLTVITYDCTEYEAELIGYDETNDVALLKVNATGLQPVTVGSSDDLVVGDQVVAIGNPLGELTSTLTVGYISAKDRTINTDGTAEINMMQTDAAINSGNSGGPLFNMKGEVVGITTAKYSGTSGSGATIEGIGFAIPIDDIIGMISDLKEYGYVTGAYLGVSVLSLDEDTAALYSLPVGSLVDSVNEGSCAEKAGVQKQDIIIGLGEYEVSSNSDLLRALRKYEAGDTTTITVYRGGKELELTITLDEKPHETTAAGEEQTADPTLPSSDAELPSEGSFEEWYKYFAPFFDSDKSSGNGNG